MISPVDGSAYAERRPPAEAQIEHALASAEAARRAWRRVSVAERTALVMRAVAWCVERADALGEELAWQMGRPIAYAPNELRRGFAERGQGVRLGLDNEIGPTGRLPVCTRGGLKARGHPVGATGMYQIVEVAQQLRGECDKTQVDGARIGMAQNIGGSGATILTHILKAE